MINVIKSYLPSNKGRWIKYTLTSLPVIFSAMIFAFNSFIDNFMAVNISGGNQALSYANSWTSLVSGIIAATTVIGSALFGQYLGLDDRKKIREVVRARMVIAVSISILFAIPALINPQFMIQLISGFDSNLSNTIKDKASLYMRWISVSWILSAWGYTLAMILREAGHGTASLISSSISLAFNVIFNSIFIFGMNKDIEFLAYSTIISMIVSLAFSAIYMWIKDKKIIVNPIKLFSVSSLIWKQFWKRSSSFALLAIGSLAVSIRFVFWNAGYPTGNVGNSKEYALSAATILGISGMFFNIFWTTFESINANIAIFVGKELGNNNIKQAKINAKELQGFHFIVALIMGLMLFSLSFAVEKMDFLTGGYEKELTDSLTNKMSIGQFDGDIKQTVMLGKQEFLKNLKWTLWPLAWNMPIWIWYITRSRVISSGGLTNITSLVDTIAGIVQTGWIALINYLIVKNVFIEFPWAYAMFFLSDLIKIPTFEILYRKLQWARNITSEGEVVQSLVEE